MPERGGHPDRQRAAIGAPGTSMDTVLQLLAFQAQTRGAAPAILAPHRPALAYRALYEQVENAGATLATIGLGRGCRIALALGNGPDTAVATLAMMSWSACAPLNPALRTDAGSALLSQLRIDALMAAEGDELPLVAAARALGLQIVRLHSLAQNGTGGFALRAESVRAAVAATAPRSDDLALVMQTSGTTSKPKIVPLTHAQILACARQLPLVVDDRALSVTPLFTYGALGVDLLAPLAAGASTVITPGFSATDFVDWLDEFRPTFYSASPTIQAAVVDALDQRKPATPCSLHYARSSSKALPQTVQCRLEAALGVPVIQGYGMTESGLIAQNPLTLGAQRLGSAGMPRHIDVAIRDAQGRALPPGAVGEVTVCGPSVMSGYEGDTEANRLAFADGWFRTGDLGYFDGDGYLFLTGRVNEIVNRGGMKLAPSEVDEIFMSHPAVLEAVAFPVPHPSLGEDLAIAIVLRPPATVSAQELHEFAIEHLVPFKVPSVVVLVTELPRNALGKVWRRGLADTLHGALQVEYVPPRDADERLIAAIFAGVLGLPRVGALDNFFSIGGDSLRGSQVIARVEADTGARMDLLALFKSPTVDRLAERLRSALRDGPLHDRPPLVPQRRGGRRSA
ncbi:MAG TPA: non-ribosomal peptide synthetase, partial [Casimicrobiaceae bacterium]|jgi:acyl-CoA synthetase (AMP-forming)/AMP-acid ligase II